MSSAPRLAFLVLALGGLGLGLGGESRADVVVTYSLGAPVVNGDKVSFAVNMTLATDPPQNAVFFSLDVAPSSSALTAGGTDFSAFSFLPSSPLLDDWNLVQDFNTGFVASAVQYETATGLGAGSYLMGTLTVDLALAGVTFDPALVVSIEGTESLIGAEVPGDPTTFDFYPAAFDPGSRTLGSGPPVAVPEPSTLSLGGLGCVLAAGWHWRRRVRRGRAG